MQMQPTQKNARLICGVGQEKKMIIFDVDGTLVGGEKIDWQCYDDAFEKAAGFQLTSNFFHSIKEITAKAIVHQALDGATIEEKRTIEAKTKKGYFDGLKKAIQNNSNSFPAIEGSISLIQDLKNHKIPVAIATGDWRETSLLKLKASGIPIDGLPMTTSSEFYGRDEIISSSIKKAGGHLENCVYIGDGHWDFIATIKLGIEFIGCGNKLDKLKEVGAIYLLDSLDKNNFWETIREMRLSNKSFNPTFPAAEALGTAG